MIAMPRKSAKKLKGRGRLEHVSFIKGRLRRLPGEGRKEER
jgi:hypothetical protein